LIGAAIAIAYEIFIIYRETKRKQHLAVTGELKGFDPFDLSLICDPFDLTLFSLRLAG
jgi:hypothetical protein